MEIIPEEEFEKRRKEIFQLAKVFRSMESEKRIILFDGVCNLCNGAVIFIIKRDKSDIFRYAAIQSDIGMELIQKYDVETSKTDSIILIENEIISRNLRQLLHYMKAYRKR